jgi:hypothetical protein
MIRIDEEEDSIDITTVVKAGEKKRIYSLCLIFIDKIRMKKN